jgi:ubiquinone/menaquinone biosynthesis C-methylase UbiE
MPKLLLLPESDLIVTGPVDHADWNYRPLIGKVQRLRFRLIRRLLGARTYGRLLEIGYGSGVFMPELARHADELFGIDPHPMPTEVEAVLQKHGLHASLLTGSAEALPYADGFFDCVVSVSAIEYVEDIEAACRELRRVLKPGGRLVIATPGSSPILDLALRASTGEDPGQYADRRQRLLPTLKQHFAVRKELAVPRFGGRLFRLYTGVCLFRE